jgi:hypothetical protein
MSKLGCRCGHVIVDQTDYLPYKGDIVPDQTFFEFLDKIDQAINDLLIATKDNKRAEWIKKHFLEMYPQDLSNIQMLGDIFSKYYFPLIKHIYQCEKCGRLWVQKDKTEQFIPFKPEDEKWESVLEKIKQQE